MFERFTERAQQVLFFAKDEAKRLGHPVVGTEHLLLGLLREGEGIAAKALQALNIDLDDVVEEVENIITKGDDFNLDEVGLTPRSKKVLELANQEAMDQGVNYVGTEHILLGLISEGEGVAAKVLEALGIEMDAVNKQVYLILNGEMPNYKPQNPASLSNKGPSQNTAPNKKKSTSPTLDQFSRDLTQMAREKKIDPVIGREKEIERVIQILSRRTKNNPVLIGEPGVGKTAIVEGLAQLIIQGNVPETLNDKRVVTLDLSGMVAGTKYRGEFEERIKKVLEEVRSDGNIVLFIDELHTLIGAGAAEGAIDASNILKPALARGELQCIGATTIDEYRKHIEKDAALERRFQPIKVGEPSKEEGIAILKGLRDRYEAHHKVAISDEAIIAAVNLSDRYITDRFLPDKAIDLIDEASSKVRLRAHTTPPDLKEIEAKIEEIRKEKESAVNGQEFEKAAKFRDEEQKLKEDLQERKDNWQKDRVAEKLTVTEEDVAQIVSSWTGVPVKKLAEEETERLLKMEELLHNRVIGQEEAVKAVARAVRRARAGLKDPKRPIGSFIFLGPTGVGKTELARALAEALFGDDDAMIRIDMSEYMEKHAVSRLVGAPPGYVGYDEGGQLTEGVRRKPYSVVLLDEIEKAHPDVFNILLQVLEDGRLTDSKGKTVDFRNTVIIMTSNVGAQTIKRDVSLGFRAVEGQGKDSSYGIMKGKIMEELKRSFRPEFLNRIDEIIVFHALEKMHIRQIVDLMLNEVNIKLKDFEIAIEVSEAAKDLLAKEGFDEMFGARPLRRAILRLIEDQLSEEKLKGAIGTGDIVLVDVIDEKITMHKKE